MLGTTQAENSKGRRNTGSKPKEAGEKHTKSRVEFAPKLKRTRPKNTLHSKTRPELAKQLAVVPEFTAADKYSKNNEAS